jgi:hypothetical protein
MPGYVPVSCVLEFQCCPGDREDGEVAFGTKVGGDPRWIQNPDYPICDFGDVMSHLLTISDWGPTTSHRRRVAAYGEDEGAIDAWKSPTGLQLGDVASLYYFVCCSCEERPVKGRFQTH